ncbi:hypothetical protein [Paenibacillus sp. FSL K6-1230]|uniref:hypothetical protein n=1 Tax=Paenibacillus sp. FSL K6-1230 TaxID=2921603 RepID=UPI000399A4F5
MNIRFLVEQMKPMLASTSAKLLLQDIPLSSSLVTDSNKNKQQHEYNEAPKGHPE